jgi:hypothetical protein
MAVYSISHPMCGASRTIRCLCPPGATAHHGDCYAGDFDAALDCTPGYGCCGEDHHHGRNANACPGVEQGHGDVACASPDPLACTAVTPPGEDCPGGHCGYGVHGCQVCRPITITVLDLGQPIGNV